MPQMPPMPMPEMQDQMSAPDPMAIIGEIRVMLDELEKSLGVGETVEVAPEFEPQDNADVMAGIPPRPKQQFPMGE